MKHPRSWRIYTETHRRFVVGTWSAHAVDGNCEWRDGWVLHLGWLDIVFTKANPSKSSPAQRGGKAAWRYRINRLLFWRRCWWCAHSGFGNWPEKVEPEAVCHLHSHDGYVLTVAPGDTCSSWEGGRGK